MSDHGCGQVEAAQARPVIVFEVVKEPYGWAVRRDSRMMTPCWCKAAAVEQARRMVDALRRHGTAADLCVEDEDARPSHGMSA